MPYKDKEKGNKAHRDMMKKRRQGVTSGVTKQGVTGEGVTRIEFIKEELIIRNKEGKVLNEHLINGIEAAAKRFNDREARYERAYRYFKNGLEPAMAFALVSDRDRLERVQTSLKGHNVDELVRYGVAGPTFDVVGELLEVTG